jgi:salicylate hydroxylase/6-hydroxynicotinate 3-monooxygenase
MGVDARVYEQAPKFARLGAGIQMSPNAIKVLRGLGLEERIRSTAFQPQSWTNREWDTGSMKFELPLGSHAEEEFQAPYLLMHRGDLHAALASAVPTGVIELGKRLVDARRTASGVEMTFADGTTALTDALVAADGVHSRIREILLGSERPKSTGRAAYRAVFPSALIEGGAIDECAKWWGVDRHIVIYYVTARRDEVYFVTSLPEPDWTRESWSATGDVEVLRSAFAGFHDQVRRVLAACPRVHKWAIVTREPLQRWSGERMVLLGDACHPMTPYMAQGAAMAMEDAVILARCLQQDAGDAERAFVCFEATRKERTSRVQLTSNTNTWMRQATDPSWVYGHDVWTTPLADGSPSVPRSTAAE